MRLELLQLFQSKFFAVSSGFFFGVIFWKYLEPTLFVSILFFVIFFSLLLFSFRYSIILLVFMSCFFVGLSTGFVRFHMYENTIPRNLLDEFVGNYINAKGLISAEIDERENGTNLKVRLESINDIQISKYKVHVLVRTDLYENKIIGDEVLVSGILEKPENFETDTGRIFNYVSYLEKENIFYILNKATVFEVSPSKDPRRFIFQLKNFFLKGLRQSLTEPASSLAGGILLGVKSSMGSVWEEIFRRAGIIHIIVLSGYNITIIADFLSKILFFANPRLRIFVGVIGIIIFAFMVGGTAPVVRASIMALIVLLSRVTYRRYNISRALIFSALIMVFITPPILISDLSFQLSFLATVGVIYGSPILEKRFGFITSKFCIRSIVATTLGAQIAVLPILLYSIGEFSLVAPFVNILVLPVIPIAMFLSFIAGIFSILIPSLSFVFGFPAYAILTYVLVVSDYATRIPLATILLPIIPGVVVLIAYAILIFVYAKAIE